MHKVILTTCFFSATILIILAFVVDNKLSIKKEEIEITEHQLILPDKKMALLARNKINEAKTFVKSHGYNDEYCFFINMNLPSGTERFLVYCLKMDIIIKSGLVTHGNCNKYWLEGRLYGNKVGCGCTSLGKYKIGKSYVGKFGLAYKLFGLDSSNSNAFERYVVLHSHPCVPAKKTEDDICQSNGCPTVNPAYLKQLQHILDASQKPILLWIYDD